jgi:hypothetical protein
LKKKLIRKLISKMLTRLKLFNTQQPASSDGCPNINAAARSTTPSLSGDHMLVSSKDRAMLVFAALWEHGRVASAVPDLQNQQNRTYNPTPGRHTTAVQTTELFIQKKPFTNACNNIAPRVVPSPVSRNQNRNGAAGRVVKGGNRGNTPAPAAFNTQTANRPRRQTGDASAATNLPPAGRGGSVAPDNS